MSLLGSTAAISRMASAPLARALNTWYACSNGTGMGVGSVKKLQPRLGGRVEYHQRPHGCHIGKRRTSTMNSLHSSGHCTPA